MHKTERASRFARQLRLAKASFEKQHLRDCIRHAELAERENPDHPDTYYWRALAHMTLGNKETARDIAAEATRRFPDNEVIKIVAAEVMTDFGQYEQARAALEDVLSREQSNWSAWTNYSAVLYNLQDYHAAKHAAERALALVPGHAGVMANYANTLKETGDVAQAVAVLRQAIQLAPRSELLRFNLLFTMLFDEGTGGLDVRREAEGCAALLTPPGAVAAQFPWPADSGRIRLGLMSNDFHAHACAYFILPFLANVDHDKVEVFAYALNSRQDNITQKVRHLADHFVDVSNKPEAEIVNTVRADRLDVLIDLGGYTRNTPLRYMAHRLAVTQMTWLGYPGTTGMAQIDYRITDAACDPAGNEAHHTEALLRAPVVAALYFPLVGRPLQAYGRQFQTQPSPVLSNGYITFGCCINLAKISNRVLRLWSGVLARVPNSRLLVECSGLEHEAVRLPLLERMAAVGIDGERVICVPREGKNQYLTYHRIDIVLDTTPMTGGANACDALWMGVPIVTLSGEACHQRLATSYLNAVGLGGLICSSEAQYVDVAADLASDPATLNALRLSLRARFEQSPVFDAAGFCRWFEAELDKLVAPYRQPQTLDSCGGEGIFFAGRWNPLSAIARAVVDALETGDDEALGNLLENISAKWGRHWLVAYALSETSYRDGDREWALELLIESAVRRMYSLPLYRLLSARLAESGHDRSALDAMLQESFGLDLAYLDQQPMPSRHEIVGVQAPVVEVAA